jgi:hypothetical protein
MNLRFAALLLLAPICGGCTGTALTNTTPSAPAGTTTATFASFLAIGGSTEQTFHVTQAGTIAVTLTVVTPAGVVGLGVGVPNASGTGCTLTNSLDASAATLDSAGTPVPQLTIPASVGTYCVDVYDSGQLDRIGRTFSVTVVHS